MGALQRMQSSSFTFKKLFRINFWRTLCHELRETLKIKKKKFILQQNPQTDFLFRHVFQNPDFINNCKKGYKIPLSK